MPDLFAHQLPRMTSSQQLFFRLDVHQNLGNFFHLLTDLVRHRMGDLVAFADRKVASHHHMQIHVIAETHLADKALFHSK